MNMADLHMKDLVELSNSVRALVKLVAGKEQAISGKDVMKALSEMSHRDDENPYKVRLSDEIAGATHRALTALNVVEKGDVVLGKAKGRS